ncbi:hypothetical protein PHLCEN_2v3860 [Hermanssonia centrifuga]|uniref:Uncharacterized protein n=1 Tax=Hermanssonia centrifuga TaxID=98765 RepID=A0A2R6QB60_9APHY|nr:hypothetical protein PHLCEN_2v3860 [Hermanssonia centrifuga]
MASLGLFPKPTIPPEIIDAILDELPKSTTTYPIQDPQIKSNFASCTLVCRTWHRCARPYLFQDLIYEFEGVTSHTDGATKLEALLTFLETSPEATEPLQDFDAAIALVGDALVQRELKTVKFKERSGDLNIECLEPEDQEYIRALLPLLDLKGVLKF